MKTIRLRKQIIKQGNEGTLGHLRDKEMKICDNLISTIHTVIPIDDFDGDRPSLLNHHLCNHGASNGF